MAVAVSLFREDDRVIVAGDAVVTTRQESLFNVLLQRRVVSRPPAYFTPDWNCARRSVQTIAALEPDVLATGHGEPMRGRSMLAELRELADHFDDAMPSSGRYVEEPAVVDRTGVLRVPRRRGRSMVPVAAALTAIGVAAAVTALGWRRARAR